MNALHKKGCINYLGESFDVTADDWVEAFERTKFDKIYQKELSENSIRLMEDNIFLSNNSRNILKHLGLDCLL